MSAQRPIAVSMVAGRVCKCGFGTRFWRWSGIGGHLPNDFFKTICRNPKYRWAQLIQSRLADREEQEKYRHHKDLCDNVAFLLEDTISRGARPSGVPLME